MCSKSKCYTCSNCCMCSNCCSKAEVTEVTDEDSEEAETAAQHDEDDPEDADQEAEDVTEMDPELMEEVENTTEEEIKKPTRRLSRRVEDIPALRKSQPSYFEKFIKGVVNIPIPLFTKPYRLVFKQIFFMIGHSKCKMTIFS